MVEHRRTAIVTGASRGIGRGIAEALGTLGFNVVVNYHASAEAAQEVVAAVCQAGGQAVAVQADIASLDDHAKLLDATHRAFGKVDLLVAGVAPQAEAYGAMGQLAVHPQGAQQVALAGTMPARNQL